MLLALHKPYGVLSQFTGEAGSRWKTLAGFGLPGRVYPIGRLDADSEGLLLLTDEPGLNSALLDPERGHRRIYWAQVEGRPDEEALSRLAGGGLRLGDFSPRPARAWRLDPPPRVATRIPPIRFRVSVPDTWIGLELIEGKNRQVRRMTAAAGHPTLRLIRAAIGGVALESLGLVPGAWRELSPIERAAL